MSPLDLRATTAGCLRQLIALILDNYGIHAVCSLHMNMEQKLGLLQAIFNEEQFPNGKSSRKSVLVHRR